jgi:hypothetical protein
MAYEKDKERMLKTIRVPDNPEYPDRSGTIVEVKQYDEYRPKLQLRRWRTNKEGEVSEYPFVEIPAYPKTVERLNGVLAKLTEGINQQEWKKFESQ